MKIDFCPAEIPFDIANMHLYTICDSLLVKMTSSASLNVINTIGTVLGITGLLCMGVAIRQFAKGDTSSFSFYAFRYLGVVNYGLILFYLLSKRSSLICKGENV